MGLGDFFKRRAQRESAIPDADTDVKALGSFASGEGQPVVGQQVSGGAPQGWSGDLSDIPGLIQGFQALSSLGPMIQQAMAQGNLTQNPDGSYSFGSVTVQQGGSQTVDLRGTPDGDALREQIMGIMAAHGIDAENPGQAGSVDAGTYEGMQQQIMDALQQAGIPTQIEPPKD
jgi:hypothetical protein